ncbi:MAG: DNA repair protein RadA [Chitinispirillaceae bacterium]|nr:DNA repair protein RadA [Chitinispirillaceae bacterium]
MSRKNKIAFVCTECGEDYPKWQGRCDNCGSWDTIKQISIAQSSDSNRKSLIFPSQKAEVKKLSDCKADNFIRFSSVSGEIDRVLGGGFVKGGCVLLGGDPGIGKSTLLLQLSSDVAKIQKLNVLYISGEESAEQVAMRADRLGIKNSDINILTETSLERILQILNQLKPDFVVIDSIQTLFYEELPGAPGSITQVRECAAMLVRFAKENDCVMIFIGHVTKEGAIAGPRILEHIVDTVLYFEGDASYTFRVLRAVKNRFGPSGEIAVLSMSDRGLKEVLNTSEFFLMNRHSPQVGTAITPILEGSRVFTVELQALVNRTHFGIPQRVASGINQRRLSLLLAVLEKYGGIMLGDFDIFFNITGGLTVAEPAIDLGIIAAIISSFRNLPLKPDLALIGEVGLGGEIRPVSAMELRLKELSRLGFKECIVPQPSEKADWFSKKHGIDLIPCSKIGNIQELLF